MDNYKIKVKDEAESKEIQELFFELGYKWEYKNLGKNIFKEKPIGFLYAEKDGSILSGVPDKGDFFNLDENKELTLPQLRDLVVLKRNDVKDAAHVDPHGTKHVDLNSQWYWFHEQQTPDIPFGWVESAGSRDYDNNVLKPITQPQDPALISGADALDALKAKKDVEYCGFAKNDNWLPALNLPVCYFLMDSFKFRLKPTTLKVNAELPKPSREFQQNTEVYAVTYEFKTREERNAFADKLRGTNS